MPEPAAWRYQKITKPMFDLPTPHLVLTGRILTMAGEVIENGFAWIGEVKETIDDHSFLVRDESNRDTIVSMFDIRSVDMAHVAQV